jgi:hypothetical protein
VTRVVVPGAVWKLDIVKTGSTLVTVTSPTAIGPDILSVPKAVVGAIPTGLVETGPSIKLAVPKAV